MLNVTLHHKGVIMPKYSKQFYKKRSNQMARYRATARAAIDTFYKYTYPGKPTRCIADIGCATGLLLGELEKLVPMTTLYGLDLLPVSRQHYRGFYTQADLNEKHIVVPDLAADLIICEEVLEHIEPDNTLQAMELITGLAGDPGLLIFGAAAPGQPGKHHVNCRTKAEWKELWGRLGWYMDKNLTRYFKQILKQNGLDKGCYFDNPQVFVK